MWIPSTTVIWSSITVRNIKIATTSDIIVSPSKNAIIFGLTLRDFKNERLKAESDAAIEEAKAKVFQNEKGRSPIRDGRLENKKENKKIKSKETPIEKREIDSIFFINIGPFSENLYVRIDYLQYPDWNICRGRKQSVKRGVYKVWSSEAALSYLDERILTIKYCKQ